MAFGAKWGFGEKQEDLPEIAKKICALPKINASRSRTVIFTQVKKKQEQKETKLKKQIKKASLFVKLFFKSGSW
jgi:hypothetical protein